MAGFGLGVLVVAIFALQLIVGYSDFLAMPDETKPNTGIFDGGLIGSFILFVLAIIAVVVFGVLQIFGDFKGSMKSLLGVGALVVIFIVAYATSSGEATGIVAAAAQKAGTSPSMLKFIGAGLTTMMLMIVGTIVVLVVSEVRNFVK